MSDLRQAMADLIVAARKAEENLEITHMIWQRGGGDTVMPGKDTPSGSVREIQEAIKIAEEALKAHDASNLSASQSSTHPS